MKNTILLLCLFIASLNLSAQNNCVCTDFSVDAICEDFDSYRTSSRLGPQSACWTTWSGLENGLEDGIIRQNGLNKYLKIQATGTTQQRVVLQLGNRTSGVYELSYDIYTYSNSIAFFGLLNRYSPNGGRTNANVYVTGSGFGYLFGGNGYETFQISNNRWNRFAHYIDLDNNRARFYVNGDLVYEYAYAESTFGGVNFSSSSSNYRYDVDNLSFRAYDAECMDITKVRPNAYCPLNFDPVCGCDGREYSNACHALNSGIKTWEQGPCNTECVNPALISDVSHCPMNIDWVCGCDDVTYYNPCIAEANGVTNWTEGPCSQTCYDPHVVEIEDIYCPQVYAPVCACNGIEYSNECEAARDGNTDWVEGPCPCVDPLRINPTVYCPTVIDWVCGCDGNTYINECTAISRGVIDWTAGPCNAVCVEPNVVVNPNVYCPQVYDPVCGCNGEEYASDCHAAQAGVLNWTPGPCPDLQCGNDIYEPNERYAKRIYTNRNNYALLCPSGDYDWFYFYSSASLPNIRVQLSSVPGDYELYVYDTNFNLVGSSTRSGTNNEEVIYNTSRGNQRYFVLIDGYLDAWNTNDTYRLRVDNSSTRYSVTPAPQASSRASKEQRTVAVDFPNVIDDMGASTLTNSPNPFTTQTDIRFNLPEATKVTLSIKDMQGREVAQLLHNEQQEKGPHSIQFDGSALSRGIYIVVLEQAEGIQTHKLILQ